MIEMCAVTRPNQLHVYADGCMIMHYLSRKDARAAT